MRKVFLMGVVLALGLAGEARAQWLPLEGRAFVDINGLYQAHSQELTRKGTFSLYDEQGSFETTHTVDNGGVWDVGFGYRVWRELSIGLGISAFSKPGIATTSGSVPHPLFFNKPRTFAETQEAAHKSRAIYLQAIWNLKVPNVDKLNVAFMLGPTHLRVTQELVVGTAISEVGSPYSSVKATLVSYDRTKSTIGVIMGADVSYMFRPNVGAGFLLRYVGGKVELPGVGSEKVKVDSAGFQVGGGARLRF